MFLEKNCRLLRNASSSFLTTLVLPSDLATLDTSSLMDTTCYEDEGLYRRVKYTGRKIATLDTRTTICQSSIKLLHAGSRHLVLRVYVSASQTTGNKAHDEQRSHLKKEG